MEFPYLVVGSSWEPIMAALLKEESTITAKGQTTVPKSVRQALGVDYGGRIAFFVDDTHRVYVEKATEDVSDPVVDRLLEFLARDMTRHPGTSIVPLASALRDRIAALVGNMDVDLEAEIDGDVTL
jgi:antitoxin PrlF